MAVRKTGGLSDLEASRNGRAMNVAAPPGAWADIVRAGMSCGAGLHHREPAWAWSSADAALRQHRFSQAIHDHAGQAIAILLLDLHGLGAFIQCAQGREHLARIRRQIDQMGSDLHRLAVGLRPATLEREGVVEACRQAADQFRRAYPVTTRLEVLGGCDRIPDAIGEALFHVLQEALTNVIRHGRGVTQVSIRLARRRGAVVLVVANDGHSPVDRPGESVRGDRLGLAGMRTRVAHLGGRLRIMRTGTGPWTVCATIPPRPVLGMKESAHAPHLPGR